MAVGVRVETVNLRAVFGCETDDRSWNFSLKGGDRVPYGIKRLSSFPAAHRRLQMAKGGFWGQGGGKGPPPRSGWFLGDARRRTLESKRKAHSRQGGSPEGQALSSVLDGFSGTSSASQRPEPRRAKRNRLKRVCGAPEAELCAWEVVDCFQPRRLAQKGMSSMSSIETGWGVVMATIPTRSKV
jgi:hypothetical protein